MTMPMTHSMGDKLLSVQLQLGTGTKYSAPIKLAEAEQTRDGRHLQADELIISFPALAPEALGTSESFALSVQFSDDENFGSGANILEMSDSSAKVTGSAAGTEEQQFSYRIPYQRGRFVRLKTVTNATTLSSVVTAKFAQLDYIV